MCPSAKRAPLDPHVRSDVSFAPLVCVHPQMLAVCFLVWFALFAVAAESTYAELRPASNCVDLGTHIECRDLNGAVAVEGREGDAIEGDPVRDFDPNGPLLFDIPPNPSYKPPPAQPFTRASWGPYERNVQWRLIGWIDALGRVTSVADVWRLPASCYNVTTLDGKWKIVEQLSLDRRRRER